MIAGCSFSFGFCWPFWFRVGRTLLNHYFHTCLGYNTAMKSGCTSCYFSQQVVGTEQMCWKCGKTFNTKYILSAPLVESSHTEPGLIMQTLTANTHIFTSFRDTQMPVSVTWFLFPVCTVVSSFSAMCLLTGLNTCYLWSSLVAVVLVTRASNSQSRDSLQCDFEVIEPLQTTSSHLAGCLWRLEGSQIKSWLNSQLSQA